MTRKWVCQEHPNGFSGTIVITFHRDGRGGKRMENLGCEARKLLAAVRRRGRCGCLLFNIILSVDGRTIDRITGQRQQTAGFKHAKQLF